MLLELALWILPQRWLRRGARLVAWVGPLWLAGAVSLAAERQ